MCPPLHKSVKLLWSQKVISPSVKFSINSTLYSLFSFLYNDKASALETDRIENSCFPRAMATNLVSNSLKSLSEITSLPKSTS